MKKNNLNCLKLTLNIRFLCLKSVLFLCVFLLSVNTFSRAQNNPTQPTQLTVNFLLQPDLVLQNGYPVNISLKETVKRNEIFQLVEIAHKQPLLGWVVNSPKSNTLQTAYRILVSPNLNDLQNDYGDFWDSGKMESENSINIQYAGNDLKPNTVYFWKVKTWDNHGEESVYSEIQQFKTAAELSDYPGTTIYPLQKQDVSLQKILQINENHSLIDFGKANFGRLRINLFGNSESDTVILYLGEKLENGLIDRTPEGSIRYGKFVVGLIPGWHTYETLIPPHYYDAKHDRIFRLPEYIGKVMPFRYCEIEKYPSKLLTSDKIQQITVSYLFDEEASGFHSSDTVLNAIWDICKHTVKATSFCGIYVDGDRERFPREADSYINQMSHYGVEREFSLARHTHEFQITYSSQWTEWLMHVVLMAWADFMETGDLSSMQHFYEDLKAKTLIALAREDGLISTRTGLVTWDVINSVHWQKTEWQRQKKEMPNFRDIVDWPQSGTLGLSEKQGETDDFEFADINTVVNAFHYRTLVLISQMAAHLNKPGDANFFGSQAELVKKSFNKILFDKRAGIYVDGEGSTHSSLHANMFAVAFGLAPEKNLPQIIEFVKNRGLVCSPYGCLYLLESLYESGEAEAALDLMTQQSNRSWARWIYEFGSTITLESWGPEYKPNLDWSHPWGSAPASIIPRKIMGIEPLEPGYGKIRIKPQPGSLEYAEIKLPTIRGDVEVSFQNIPGEKFELKVTIPANMQADIYIPIWNKKQGLNLNGKPVELEESEGFLVVENIGSGNNTFEIEQIK